MDGRASTETVGWTPGKVVGYLEEGELGFGGSGVEVKSFKGKPGRPRTTHHVMLVKKCARRSSVCERCDMWAQSDGKNSADVMICALNACR